MPLDEHAVRRWNQGQHAYAHYRAYLGAKPEEYRLGMADLVYLKNAHGGYAMISESPLTLPAKLRHYEEALRECSVDPGFGFPLGLIAEADYRRARSRMLAFAGLPARPEARITGVGTVLAVALLHHHFPAIVPLFGWGRVGDPAFEPGGFLPGQSVPPLLAAYGDRIDATRLALQRNPVLTVRELDGRRYVAGADAAVIFGRHRV